MDEKADEALYESHIHLVVNALQHNMQITIKNHDRNKRIG